MDVRWDTHVGKTIKGSLVVSTVYTTNNDAIGHITQDNDGHYQYHVLTDQPTFRSEFFNTQDAAELLCMLCIHDAGYTLDRARNRLTVDRG
jgi:hypothetical protein